MPLGFGVYGLVMHISDPYRAPCFLQLARGHTLDNHPATFCRVAGTCQSGMPLDGID